MRGRNGASSASASVSSAIRSASISAEVAAANRAASTDATRSSSASRASPRARAASGCNASSARTAASSAAPITGPAWSLPRRTVSRDTAASICEASDRRERPGAGTGSSTSGPPAGSGTTPAMPRARRQSSNASKHVGLAEIDPHGPTPRALAGSSARSSDRCPASATLRGMPWWAQRDHALERRPGNANQVAVILAAEIRLEIAAVSVDIGHDFALALPHEPQAVQRQLHVHVIDQRRLGRHHRPPGHRSRPPAPRRRVRPSCAARGLPPCRRSPRTSPTASTRPCWCRSPSPASCTSMRGSRAARWNNASAEICGPGQITPPRYSPFAEIASNVVAVPKSTTMIGVPTPH